jgi:hypothetical protein
VNALVKGKIFFDKSRGGTEQVKVCIDSGDAGGKLDSLIDFTQQCEFFVCRAI